MTILPLDTWRAIIGVQPWHFWGWADTNIVPLTSACNDVTQKYAWQDADAAGRFDISQAIEQAEARLTGYLRFAPAPHYIVEDPPYPRYPDERVDRLGYIDAAGRWPAIQMNEGMIQKCGVLTRTLVDTKAITYTDPDGDGLDELATITLPVTFTDTSQLTVYIAAADRLNSDPVGDEYKITPIKVAISGGNATVRINSWLLAKPILYEGYDTPIILDPTESANFVTTLEVYHEYIDPTGITADTAQAKLIWETQPHPYFCYCSTCNPTGVINAGDPAAEGYAVARVALRQADLGLLGIGQAAYNSTSGQFTEVNWFNCRPPDRVQIRAWAGKPLVNGAMELRMQRVVAYMAAAELAKPICACQDSNRNLYHWQFDLARTGGADGEQYGMIAPEDLSCPYGTRRGHIYAWKETRDLRLLTGWAI